MTNNEDGYAIAWNDMTPYQRYCRFVHSIKRDVLEPSLVNTNHSTVYIFKALNEIPEIAVPFLF